MHIWTLENDVKDLLNNEPEVPDRMREWVNAQLKHCNKSFKKYDNTMEKSMKLINGLYKQDLAAELFIAPTQFGKTSTVFWTAHNLMTHIDMKYFVPYPFVFIISGLNSNSWKEQTRDRVLPGNKDNVWHNKDICNEDNAARLKAAVMSNHNTLIIIDEVHVGTKLDHVIFNTLREFHPEHNERSISQLELFEFLHSKKVKFLLVSATPDAIKETMEQHWPQERYKTVVAYPDTAPTYVWHKHFLTKGRVHQAYNMQDKTPQGISFHNVIIQRIVSYKSPMYHMIRFPTDAKKSEIEVSRSLLEASVKKCGIEADIVLWDAKNSMKNFFAKKNYKVFENENISKSTMMNMSNEDILKEKPERHTIFILKELFRVAQTMPIENIGVLVDRDTKTPCDSTLSQSLIGRACGHNKHEFIDQILIYTHVQSVINYIRLWENHFDYSKVPGYVGNGVSTNKKGDVIKANTTMLGNELKRKANWSNHEEVTKKDTIKEDQEDTPERLARIAKAYRRSNGIVKKIIDKFVDNEFKPIKDLGVKNFANYDRYAGGKHCQLRIVMKVDGMWVLRNEVKEYLKI